MNKWNAPARRQAVLGVGVRHARIVRNEVGYNHPTELKIEVLAHMRGILVRSTSASGARACLLRVAERAIIGIASGLSEEARRWAIAHELGHFEAHAKVSYLGLCTGEDLRTDYGSDGREPEANAFAAELLMPEDLVKGRCDVPEVRWEPIEQIASDFQVSLMAAGRRFVSFTDDRVAVVCCKNGKVIWSDANRPFGKRPERGSKLDQWSLAYDFFEKDDTRRRRETISASAWIPDVGDTLELVEHVIPMTRLGMTFSLLWYPPR